MVRLALRAGTDWGASRRGLGFIFLSVIVVAAIADEKARGQEIRSGATRVDFAPLARCVPRQDLLLFLEFDGFDAHPKRWRSSAAFKLLNDTKLGALLEDLALQGIELIQDSIPREKRISGADALDLLKGIAREGFVVAVSRDGPDDRRIVLAARRGDRPEMRRLLGIVDFLLRRSDDESSSEPLVAQVKAGRTIHPLGGKAVWMIDNGDLIVTEKKNFENILSALDGKEPNAIKHALRAELATPEDGFQPAAIGFVDMAALAPISPEAVRSGLDGLKRIELRWGFHEGALMTRLQLVAPGPRRGALSLLDAPSFGVESIHLVPQNVTALTVLSIEPAKAFVELSALAKLVGAEEPPQTRNVGVAATRSLDLQSNLLNHLGPALTFYAQSPRVEEAASAASLLMSQVSGFTFAGQVRDEVAVSRGLPAAINALNSTLRRQMQINPRDPLTRILTTLSFHRFERAADRRPAYVMDLPANVLPQPFVAMLRPTVMLGRDRLVVSASTAAAEQALAPGARWQAPEAFLPVINKLPREMVYLSLSDPRAGTEVFTEALPILVRQVNAEIALSRGNLGKNAREVSLRLDPDLLPAAAQLDRLLFPSTTTLVVDRDGATLTHREAIPTLASPAVAGGIVALLIPTLQSARDAARRARCLSNLRQIALAMHNYHSANGAFPRPAILDEKGKPLLSWRVAILPYVGQQDLYNRFKQDEPWDGPNNKALLKEMPPVFLCPSRTGVEPFTTTYRAFVGNGAMFEKDQDIGVVNVTDGTSNTIMVVEAKQAVPWTKPDDLSFHPVAPPSLRGTGSPHPGGFNAAMADGAVRFIKNTINLDVFRALITRAAGEVIGAGAF
jgi:prepilin-type processing-associated H-X9-DG protein